MTTNNAGAHMRSLVLQVLDVLLDVSQAAVDVVQRLDEKVALLHVGADGKELEMSACLLELLGEMFKIGR